MHMPTIGNEWTPTAHLIHGILPPDQSQPVFCQIVSAYRQIMAKGRQGPKGMLPLADGQKYQHYTEAFGWNARSFDTYVRRVPASLLPKDATATYFRKTQHEIELITQSGSQSGNYADQLVTLVSPGAKYHHIVKWLSKTATTHAINSVTRGKPAKRFSRGQVSKRTRMRIRAKVKFLNQQPRTEDNEQHLTLLLHAAKELLALLSAKDFRIIECSRTGCTKVFVRPFLRSGGKYRTGCLAHSYKAQ